MGYGAEMHGLFMVKDRDKVKEISKTDEFGYEFGDTWWDCDGNLSCNGYGNWHPEDVESLLLKLAPYIEDGSELDCNGDCHEYWRYVFRDGKWFCQEGRVTYDASHETELKANSID